MEWGVVGVEGVESLGFVRSDHQQPPSDIQLTSEWPTRTYPGCFS